MYSNLVFGSSSFRCCWLKHLLVDNSSPQYGWYVGIRIPQFPDGSLPQSPGPLADHFCPSVNEHKMQARSLQYQLGKGCPALPCRNLSMTRRNSQGTVVPECGDPTPLSSMTRPHHCWLIGQPVPSLSKLLRVASSCLPLHEQSSGGNLLCTNT